MVELIFIKNDDFLKVPKLQTSIQRIVFNHSRLWKPSRKLVRTFFTPKIDDRDRNGLRNPNRSTYGPELIGDMESTHLEVSGTAVTLLWVSFFKIRRNRGNQWKD